MTIARIRGIAINFEVVGTAGPWLALITGGRRSYAEFVPLAQKIAAHGFRVVLHDRRNTGASQIVIAGEQGEEEIWTDDIVALMDHLGAAPAFYGGASSGARTCMLTYLRHPEAVRALMLMRVTGGDFAAGRLPEMYYQQFIRAAQQGGMAAVCATEQYQERIGANPANEPYLMAMDPAEYIRVMQHWLAIFTGGPIKPVMGVTESQLRAIDVPTLVVPGNDKTHASANGLAAAALIPGAEVLQLPIEDQDLALIPFTEWAPHEAAIAQAFADFMHRHDKGLNARPTATRATVVLHIPQPSDPMFIQANGIRMRYEVDGPADAPWVTFVTGIANDVTLFDGQAAALSDRFRVLRYDLRGQGQTEATPPPYTIEGLASDLIALWDALHIKRSHLVGLGLGSTVAMRAAIDHPERIAKLVPSCCRARMVPDFLVMWGKLTDTVKAGGVEAIVEQTAQRWFTDDFKQAHPDVLDKVRAMVRSTSLDGYLGCVSAFVGLDLEDELKHITVPTLFMGGADDKSGGPEVLMRGLAAQVPGASYVPVPNAAHIANVQNNDGFNAILRQFLLAA